MTKQRCIKRIYDKIRPKSPPNRATSPTCHHCDVAHLSLTTGIVALHIPSWRIEVREERRQAHKTVWPVDAGRVICRYQNNLCGIINHHKHIKYSVFGCISRGFKHNHNKPYRHWRQDGGYHALSIVTHATAWRRGLSLYTSRCQGQPLQFRAKNPRGQLIILYSILSISRGTPSRNIRKDAPWVNRMGDICVSLWVHSITRTSSHPCVFLIDIVLSWPRFVESLQYLHQCK